MTLLDRIRIERAVLSFDWWLDLRGAPGRRRRQLRRELRSNLVAATADAGSRAAVRHLGEMRRLAAETVAEDGTRARWTAGLQAGATAVVATLLVQLLAALAWWDGAMAARPDGAVTGSLTPFPGSTLRYVPQDGGFALSLAPGWTSLAVGLLVLVVVARPWRVRARSARDRGASAVV